LNAFPHILFHRFPTTTPTRLHNYDLCPLRETFPRPHKPYSQDWISALLGPMFQIPKLQTPNKGGGLEIGMSL
jgi:hypothetical protein